MDVLSLNMSVYPAVSITPSQMSLGEGRLSSGNNLQPELNNKKNKSVNEEEFYI